MWRKSHVYSPEKDAENATLYKKMQKHMWKTKKELDTQAKESFASIEENKNY